MKPQLEVRIQYGPFDADIVRLRVQLSDWDVNGTLQPIKRTSECGHPIQHALSEMICTPYEVRRKVSVDREKLARFLSIQLTDALIKLFDERDLIDGYPKDREK